MTRFFHPSAFIPLQGRWAKYCRLGLCLLGCVMVMGCAGEGNDDERSHRHLPKADMTEAYPKKPFREVHHPPPVYWGGMVPIVQTIQPTPDEISGRALRANTGGVPGVPMAPPETRTDVMYGAPSTKQTP
ncbi:hypothetical protein BG621_07735 [Parasaccharibacter apium]|nr:hypothetical protein BG621_07735 [Parasaccharibacter apium]